MRYDVGVTLFSRRLPHVLPPRDLVRLLVPTYAAARNVDEDEAAERLSRAVAVPGAVDGLYRGVSAALHEAQGPRTGEDQLMDKLSAGVIAHRSAKAAPVTAAISAALVRLDVEIGLAPEAMRDTLATPRGAALLEEGLRALGAHLVKTLLR